MGDGLGAALLGAVGGVVGTDTAPERGPRGHEDGERDDGRDPGRDREGGPETAVVETAAPGPEIGAAAAIDDEPVFTARSATGFASDTEE
jgi:hypothetical protein